MSPTKNQTTKMTTSEHGKVHFVWTFSEFIKHQRTGTWYFWSGLFFLALIIWSLLDRNFLFAIALVMVALIIALHENCEPLAVNFEINEEGIIVGRRFTSYKDIDKFFLIYEPPEVKTLHFEFKNWWRPRLSVPLEEQDPIKIREVLLQYLSENPERTEEPLSDYLSRKWKL